MKFAIFEPVLLIFTLNPGYKLSSINKHRPCWEVCKKWKGQLLRKLAVSSVFTEYSYVVKERAVNNWNFQFISNNEKNIIRWIFGLIPFTDIKRFNESKAHKDDNQFWFYRSNLANLMQNKEKCNASPMLKLWKGKKIIAVQFSPHLIFTVQTVFV